MGALRLTALAAVVAAFLIAPAALLAEQPAPDSSLSPAVDSPGYGAAAESGTTAGPSAVEQSGASVSLRTSGSSAEATKEPQAASSAGTQVTIGDFFFRPQDVTISLGDTVTWTNDGSVPEGHTATGSGFDSGVLKQGETFDHTFNKAGTFDYVCTLHPNMRGTITVTAPTGGDSGSGGTSSGSSSTPTPTAPTTPVVPTTPTATGAGGSGGSLAQTGLNLVLLAEIAGCLIATGLLIRRLVYG